VKRHIGQRTVDLATGEVEGRGLLRPRELALLRYLLDHCDRVVPGEELLERVWGYRPGVRTKTLYSTIHRLRERLEEDPARPVHVLAERGEGYRLVLEPRAPEPSLPALVDRFVGREVLLGAGARALERSRLVTLVGGPGFGKTRLARQLLQGRAGPVRWMTVAPEAFLWPSLARLLALESAPSERPPEVARALRALGPCWLGLDDADRLPTSERAALLELLQNVPELRLLSTAREPLGLPGELLVEVGPLSAEESEELLHDRVPDPAGLDRALLSRLSGRLQGVPLALELAAALVPTLGLPGLLEALERSIETLDIAASPLRPGLSAAIARSWAVLAPDERRALLGLAVFQASFTLEAASAVLGPGAIGAIARLTRRSLLHPAPSEGTARYRILDPIRETLLSWVSDPELEQAELAHALWCYAQARDALEMSQMHALARALPELRRAAAVFARRGREEEALQLTLWTANRVPPESCTLELLDDLGRRAASCTRPEDLRRLEGCRARLLQAAGRVAEALAAARRSLRLAATPEGQVLACIHLLRAAALAGDHEAVREATAAFEAAEPGAQGTTALQGRIAAARAWLEIEPERLRSLLDGLDPGRAPVSETDQLYIDTLRAVSRAGSEPARAESELREIRRRYQAMGSESNVAQVSHALIQHLLRQGRADDAEQELGAMGRAARPGPVHGLFGAWLAWLRGEPGACRQALQQALSLAEHNGDPHRESQICAALGQLERAEGRWGEARRWWSRAALRYPFARHELWELVIRVEAGEQPELPPGSELPLRCAAALLGRADPPALPHAHELADRIGADLTRRRAAPR
jgi:predicted ATPase